MPSWASVGSVLLGAVVTVICASLAVLAIVTLGVLGAVLVGPGLPTIVFIAALVHCPMAGGVTAAGLRPYDRRESVLVGGVAGALGTLLIGLVIGAILGLIALGMMPYQGQDVDAAAVTLWMAGLGGLGGIFVGGALGGVGGVLVAIGR